MRTLSRWSIVPLLSVIAVPGCGSNPGVGSPGNSGVVPGGDDSGQGAQNDGGSPLPGGDGGGPANDGSPATGDSGGPGPVNDGGGPMAYSAPTDTSAHAYSALAAPGENVPTTDPDFVHTSSGGLCKSTETCFIRASGPALWSQIASQFTGVTGGPVSFATESGSVFNTWDVDDSHVVFGANAGNQSVVMNFDPATGAVSFNQIPPHTITSGTGLFHFSKTEPHIVYGYPNLSQMDVTDGSHTVTQVVDLGATCNLPITVTTTGGGWDSTPDNTGAGHDMRYASYIGPQNTAELAVVYDRPTGTCFWYDTKLDTMGGSKGAPTCAGCAGFTGAIHGLEISADGDFVDITDNGIGVVIWKVGTTTLTHASELDKAGHGVLGQHTRVSGPSSQTGKWLAADLDTPITTFYEGPRLSNMTDQHNGWVNINATATNPMYTLPYPNGGNGACQDATSPNGTNEVQMVAMDASDVTYRFMHARKNVCLDNFWFYHEVSGNVSRSGRFAVFSTNWDGTLGQFTTQGTTLYRNDAFIVELR